VIRSQAEQLSGSRSAQIKAADDCGFLKSYLNTHTQNYTHKGTNPLHRRVSVQPFYMANKKEMNNYTIKVLKLCPSKMHLLSCSDKEYDSHKNHKIV
jgi:hypothetical protein